jgi:hypothetical protein
MPRRASVIAAERPFGPEPIMFAVGRAVLAVFYIDSYGLASEALFMRLKAFN